MNWFERVSAYLTEKGLPGWAIEVSVFGLLGAIFGFLAKTIGRPFGILLLVAIGALIVLHYAHVAPETVTDIEQFLGVHDMSWADAPQVVVNWARAHVIACVSTLVGIVIGWKLG